MNKKATREFSFFEPNLIPVLLIFSRVIKYNVDSNDLETIKYALTATSVEKDMWYDYPLIGNETINLRLARKEEISRLIFIELSFDDVLSGQIDLCIFVIQDFYIEHKKFYYDMKIYE